MERVINLDERYKSGQLVKNINSQEVGVILETENNHEDYYRVLCEGEIVSWFSCNLTIFDRSSATERSCQSKKF